MNTLLIFCGFTLSLGSTLNPTSERPTTTTADWWRTTTPPYRTTSTSDPWYYTSTTSVHDSPSCHDGTLLSADVCETRTYTGFDGKLESARWPNGSYSDNTRIRWIFRSSDYQVVFLSCIFLNSVLLRLEGSQKKILVPLRTDRSENAVFAAPLRSHFVPAVNHLLDTHFTRYVHQRNQKYSTSFAENFLIKTSKTSYF